MGNHMELFVLVLRRVDGNIRVTALADHPTKEFPQPLVSALFYVQEKIMSVCEMPQYIQITVAAAFEPL